MFVKVQVQVQRDEHRESTADDTDLRHEVQTIMDNVVTKSSVGRYNNGIVNFFFWVFDDCNLRVLLFKQWFATELLNSHGIDQTLTSEKKENRGST